MQSQRKQLHAIHLLPIIALQHNQLYIQRLASIALTETVISNSRITSTSLRQRRIRLPHAPPIFIDQWKNQSLEYNPDIGVLPVSCFGLENRVRNLKHDFK